VIGLAQRMVVPDLTLMNIALPTAQRALYFTTADRQWVVTAYAYDDLIAELTTIPGIGPWTVHGALLIAHGREDVVLPGDLALRKAIVAAYHLDRLPTQQEILDIADKWRPYRSRATSYLSSAAYESAEAPPVAPPAPSRT
jgi:3-methyladenine DNA glycosylase/8-oxoguanine DNA glycosylase